MRILCSICLGCFKSKNDKARVLQCGHVFHKICLKKWMRIQKVCPQCRAGAVSRSRIHFEVEASPEKPSELQLEVESLNEQNLQYQVEIIDLKKKAKQLEASVQINRSATRNLSLIIDVQKDSIKSMRRQILRLSEENRRLTQMEQENVSLQETVNYYKEIQKVMNESKEKVMEIIQNTPVNQASIQKLHIYSDILAIYMNKHKTKWRKKSQKVAQYKNKIKELKKKIPKKVPALNKKTEADEKSENDEGGTSHDNTEGTSRNRLTTNDGDEGFESELFNVEVEEGETLPWTEVRSAAPESSDSEPEIFYLF